MPCIRSQSSSRSNLEEESSCQNTIAHAHVPAPAVPVDAPPAVRVDAPPAVPEDVAAADAISVAGAAIRRAALPDAQGTREPQYLTSKSIAWSNTSPTAARSALAVRQAPAPSTSACCPEPSNEHASWRSCRSLRITSLHQEIDASPDHVLRWHFGGHRRNCYPVPAKVPSMERVLD